MSNSKVLTFVSIPEREVHTEFVIVSLERVEIYYSTYLSTEDHWKDVTYESGCQKLGGN